MQLHDILKAAYQIPCCFSLSVLIVSTARMLLREFWGWLNGAELWSSTPLDEGN
jgi:hypothetical protein